jgi:hypothetical protein
MKRQTFTIDAIRASSPCTGQGRCSAEHPDDVQCQPCDWNWRHFPTGRVGWCYMFSDRVKDCAQRRCVYTPNAPLERSARSDDTLRGVVGG